MNEPPTAHILDVAVESYEFAIRGGIGSNERPIAWILIQ
jgi:hypothetical protein